MNIGIVGCGTIGAEVARALVTGTYGCLRLVALNDSSAQRASQLAESLGNGVQALSLEKLIEATDMVVEATAKAVMPAIVERALLHGRDVLAMSVGGLADAPHLLELAESKKAKLYLPSGALAGIDAILAAREDGLDEVSLTTTKHPRSLAGAPYLVAHGIELDNQEGKKQIIFQGNAREAVEGFPANANVAITLSFAGIGMEKTKVCFIADPSCTSTIQEIRATGSVGRIHCISEGKVSPINPKTGHLAVLSAFALLRKIGGYTRIGS